MRWKQGSCGRPAFGGFAGGACRQPLSRLRRQLLLHRGASRKARALIGAGQTRRALEHNGFSAIGKTLRLRSG